ncbi:MAG: tetratricopeptide repeat protein [Candidatus Melainabacteria bacterium]|nr:tetratricopeptide repeat protein [Candidatus Melainabacteria bacterium]
MNPLLLILLLTALFGTGTAYGARNDWDEGPPNQNPYADSRKGKSARQGNKPIDTKLWKSHWDAAYNRVSKGQLQEAVQSLEAAVKVVLGSEAGNTRLHETLQVLRPLYLRLGLMDRRRALVAEMQKANTPLYLVLEAQRIGTLAETVSLIDSMIAASKFAEAEELCDILIAKEFEEMSFDARGKVIDRLTRVYYHSKKFEKAETFLKGHLKAYATKKKEWGKDERTYIAYLSADLALIFMATEKYPEAEELWNSSLELLSELYPPEYPKIIIDTSDLALLHTKMGKLKQAVQEYEISYKSACEQPLISNASRRTIASNYAKALRDAGDNGLAKRIEKTERLEVDKPKRLF